MRKLISFLLSFILLVSTVSIGSIAFAEEKSVEPLSVGCQYELLSKKEYAFSFTPQKTQGYVFTFNLNARSGIEIQRNGELNDFVEWELYSNNSDVRRYKTFGVLLEANKNYTFNIYSGSLNDNEVTNTFSFKKCTHPKRETNNITPATIDADGSYEKQCVICGDIENKIIPRIETVKLQTKNIAHTGKLPVLSAVVYDKNDKTIVPARYKIYYDEESCEIGTHKARIVFDNVWYSGEFTRNFKIIPRNATIKTITHDNNYLRVYYKTKKSYDGVQIKISDKQGVTRYKTLKKTSGSFGFRQKMKKGRVYRFQIRSYKIVDGKKYYSSWSKIKKAKY